MALTLPEPFAIGYFNSAVARPGMRVTKKHVIPTYQLEIVREAGGVTYLDEEAIEIVPHLILCAKPGQVRNTRLPFRCHYIQLCAGQGALYDLLARLPSHWQSDAAHTDVYVQKIEHLATLFRTQASQPSLSFYSELLAFLSDLVEEGRTHTVHAEAAKSAGARAVQEAIAYMKHHLYEKCTLETLAAHVNFSPIYFHRLFTQTVGKSPCAYLLSLRLSLSRQLLATTDTPLCEIAQGCGFSTQAYFQYVFQKEFAQTPTAYRRAQQKDYLV